MKKNIVYIIVVLVILIMISQQDSFGEYIGSVKKRASTTSLYITDLQNIELNGLSTTSYGYVYALNFQFVTAGFELKGNRHLDNNVYFDGGNSQSGQLYVSIQPLNGYSANIAAGDYITITYDGGQTLKVYLPSRTTNVAISLYVADDGSTYIDSAMTNLAQAAPGCTPDCSCASSTCIGSTCDDGCGGTCAGTQTCATCSYQSWGDCDTYSKYYNVREIECDYSPPDICNNNICTFAELDDCDSNYGATHCGDGHCDTEYFYEDSSSCPSDCGSNCNTNADTDCDGCVEDIEFPNAVNEWLNQGTISDQEFPTVVNQWLFQTGC